MPDARPAPVIRPGIFLPVSLLLLLLVGVFSVFTVLRQADDVGVRARAREKGAERAGAVSARIAADLEALSSVRDLFHASVSVEEDEFECFAKGIRERLPEVVSLSWRPLPTTTPRSGGLDVLYIDPQGARFDLEPLSADVVDQTVREGLPSYLPLPEGGGAALRFALAVRGGTNPQALSVGLVTVVLDRRALLAEATAGLPQVPLELDLADTRRLQDEPADGEYRKMLRRSGDRLAVRCVPTPEYLAGARSDAPWIVLASGLLLICVLVEYYRRMVREAARVELLVRERTDAYDELRRVQQRIVREERLHALGEMASGVAHDFNNALAPILGFSELMVLGKEDPEDTATVREFFQLIHTSAKDAAQVVRRLTEFYRRRGAGEPVEPVEPHAVAQEVLRLTEPKWKAEALARGATIEASMDAQPTPWIEVEVSGLREALTNLVINAVDAMPRGGALRFSTRTGERPFEAEGAHLTAGHAVIEVADTGIGMTEQVRLRCLEPFFTTKGAQGTGLGLAMVYGFVRRHGGAIEVESDPDRGTTVRLRLPALRSTAEETAAPERPSVRHLRILLVDDDADVLRVHRRLLESEGHTVVCATNGREALERFDAAAFDVVLTDSAMPGMNGPQLAQAIRLRRREQRIVLFTGLGDLIEAGSEARECVDQVLSKPITLDALRSTLVETVPR